ncbi:MAG: glutathione S-transferase N-terminal domain-containing protein [Planctomycetota bacterium]|jgi:glutathione S-transferase|nr:glutathione S-transferase N-terminal domain-containing protein [Planctomycetota bacterium]
MLKIYQFDSCPYCQRVLNALDQHGTEYEKVDISPWDRGEVKRISGQTQVPVLVDEERGEVIPDSSRILEYLEAHYFSPNS